MDVALVFSSGNHTLYCLRVQSTSIKWFTQYLRLSPEHLQLPTNYEKTSRYWCVKCKQWCFPCLMCMDVHGNQNVLLQLCFCISMQINSFLEQLLKLFSGKGVAAYRATVAGKSRYLPWLRRGIFLFIYLCTCCPRISYCSYQTKYQFKCTMVFLWPSVGSSRYKCTPKAPHLLLEVFWSPV